MKHILLLTLLSLPALGQSVGNYATTTDYNSFGAINVSEAAATNITAGTDTAIAGTCTLSGLETDFTNPSGCRLTYTGSAVKTFMILLTVSYTSDQPNLVTDIEIAKNGSVLTPSIQQNKVGAGADIAQVTSVWVTSMKKNDYVEPYVDADGNAAVTAVDLTMVVDEK